MLYNCKTRKARARKSEIQPWLDSKFKANLAYMRFYLKRTYKFYININRKYT